MGDSEMPLTIEELVSGRIISTYYQQPGFYSLECAIRVVFEFVVNLYKMLERIMGIVTRIVVTIMELLIKM